MASAPLMIDGGKRTGFALWKPGLTRPRGGLVDMPDVRSIGRYFNAFADWMIPFCEIEEITEVGVEAPIISDHGGAGVNIYEVDKNFAIVHAVEASADRVGIPCSRIPRGTVCKHVAGVGKGTTKQLKTYCMLACQRKGWSVSDHNLADALATLDFYVFDRRIDVPWNCQPAPGPLFEQQGVRIEKTNQAAAARVLSSALSFDRAKTGTQ